ncbi:carbohydrate ABC transporter permease [Cohnella silvisoli]|uniref:Sugar ABC transporter permease n=1 Tax=Cohnella silvisoli TaxID=2873699 RepID=A0ABV1KUF1_9BACL|nr:sugar ABC transporter permease [Cohnella silvisoli]MCD9021515.1 sugar ABC transporter permease [Cohnella silvisoli]
MERKRRKLKAELKWASFLVPALMFYLAFYLLPTLSSGYYSLTDWDGVKSRFIGLDNYREMLNDRMIVASFRNTLLYTVGITVLQNGIGLLAALLLVRKFRGVNAMRTMIFMPYIFSTLLIGYVWGFILEPNIGIVNNVLDALHLGELKQGWLSEPSLARWMIVLVTVWQCLGYSMVIFIAGLQGIPKDLYECGDLDGAIGWRRFWNITFPLIAPAFTINVILCLIGDLQLFNQIFALTGGGPGYSTESIATMIYHLGFGNGVRWGYGSALSVTLFVSILALTTVMVTFLRRREVEL